MDGLYVFLYRADALKPGKTCFWFFRAAWLNRSARRKYIQSGHESSLTMDGLYVFLYRADALKPGKTCFWFFRAAWLNCSARRKYIQSGHGSWLAEGASGHLRLIFQPYAVGYQSDKL